MDDDSSSKFIGSLTKFLQSLCNGYVEFQKGVELVGHIYLNIDTGEKVDYVLHERVSKNDENSVSFVSNSFHAQPNDKKKDNKDRPSAKSSYKNSRHSDDDDDNDIMIVDQSDMPGSTNTGTVSGRSTGSVDFGRGHHRQGGINPMSSQHRNRQQVGGPSSTVTSRDARRQENISIGSVKLEQLSADELLSVQSQVDDEGPSQGAARDKRSSSLDAGGQPAWIKQELPDDIQGGSDTGWSHGVDGLSDTSNSGSDLYPVMMHSNPAYSSSPVFPSFSSSGQSSDMRHHSQAHPGMSGAAGHPYGNPMPGTSQGMDMTGMDPAARYKEKKREENRRYYQRLKQDPERFRRVRKRVGFQGMEIQRMGTQRVGIRGTPPLEQDSRRTVDHLQRMSQEGDFPDLKHCVEKYLT